MDTIRDVTIGWEIGDEYAEVNTPNCRIRGRLRKLHEQRPEDFQRYVENEDGSVYAKVPVKWVKISPPRHVEMTDERRTASAERLRKYREDKNATMS